MGGIEFRAKSCRDDGLALFSDVGHIVEIVWLHRKCSEQPGDPPILRCFTNPDLAMPFTAGLVEFLVRNSEANMMLTELRATCLLPLTID